MTAAPITPARASNRALPDWATQLQRIYAGGRDRCIGKVRYTSEQAARGNGQGFLRKTEAPVSRLWPYACTHCRGWHLTKREGATPAVTALSPREGVPL
ncbi:hypothetical protein KOAAANKH_00125 [Brevundimonas sp. NIBR10]|uniref:hypothetical protein n=1 Tax=Brevundimonas sp. NIBR10 TaxID=3015997 RepID=UPI0022F1B79B|nr:hypothetical protein [Brevundimonas sp. NIBR10]WGM45264.1 hypothetical protein KOAAANKH_00125 [Brevundimonas sp. NIBR10]